MKEAVLEWLKKSQGEWLHLQEKLTSVHNNNKTNIQLKYNYSSKDWLLLGSQYWS